MSFATWYYPFFLAASAAVFWILPRRMRLAFVLLVSFVFYGFWDLRFCALLLAAAASDFLCTRAIEGARPAARTAFAIGMLPALWLAAVAVAMPVEAAHIGLSLAACLGFLLAFSRFSAMAPERGRRLLLYLAIGVNLGILVVFKYANWFSRGLQALLQHAGLAADSVVLDVLLPIGISFHTFQSIAYAVDVYNGRCAAERRFGRVLCMIMFFPQLVAGPIERGARMLPQLRFEQAFDWRLVAWGGHLLLMGYFLKVFVADNCAVLADYYFAQVHHGHALGRGWAMVGTAAYAAQIYGDFVGYSYIARGSAMLLGVELTRNFELPFLSRSPAEFWRRWHISLSTWIRDYVFLPLSLSLSFRERPFAALRGAAGDTAIVVFCLVVTMLLAGLWHGADWHYIAFGGFYGVAQSLWILIPGAAVLSTAPGALPKAASRLLTFALACAAWILFRSESLDDAVSVFGAFADAHGIAVPIGVLLWLLVHVVPLALLVYCVRDASEEADIARRPRAALAAAYVGMVLLLASSEAGRAQFIYFQF